MSEEEKKAIEWLKEDVIYWLDKGKDYIIIDNGYNHNLHLIKDLLEKQHKEIKELKKKLRAADREEIDYMIIYQSGLYDEEERWKKKIRDKINEIKEWDKEIGQENSWQSPYQINLLNELLEE